MMKTNKFPIALIAVVITAIFASCSSDDAPEQTKNTTVFKSSAATLNNHLDDTHQIDGVSCGVLRVVARENPDVRLKLYDFVDVMEIPAKGGTYDFTVNDDSRLIKLSIYENVEFFPHDYTSLWSREHDAYMNIEKDRTPDREITFSKMNDSDKMAFGTLENADPESDLNSFTYTFPENHTGKYRLISIQYSYIWHDMTQMGPVSEERVETSNYFIQMPD